MKKKKVYDDPYGLICIDVMDRYSPNGLFCICEGDMGPMIQESDVNYDSIQRELGGLQYVMGKNNIDKNDPVCDTIFTLTDGLRYPEDGEGCWCSTIWEDCEKYEVALKWLEKMRASGESFPALEEVVRNFSYLLKILEPVKKKILENALTADHKNIVVGQDVFWINNKGKIEKCSVVQIDLLGIMVAAEEKHIPYRIYYKDRELFSSKEAAVEFGIKAKLQAKRAELMEEIEEIDRKLGKL